MAGKFVQNPRSIIAGRKVDFQTAPVEAKSTYNAINDLSNQADALSQSVSGLSTATQSISGSVAGKLDANKVAFDGAAEGKLWVFGSDLIPHPRYFVPFSLGVGISGDPTYRFQVTDGPVDTHLTGTPSGGVSGWVLNKAASGTATLAYSLASGGVLLWGLELALDGSFRVTNEQTSGIAIQCNPDGTVLIPHLQFPSGDITAATLELSGAFTGVDADFSGEVRDDDNLDVVDDYCYVNSDFAADGDGVIGGNLEVSGDFHIFGASQGAIPNPDGTLNGATFAINSILTALRAIGLIQT